MLDKITYRKRILLLFYIIGLVGLFLPDAVCGADPDICPRCGQSDCEYMAGINLAGAEFGRNIPGVEGRDYGWPKIEELDYWQSKGIRLVRLPFMWERLQPVLNEAFDAGYLAGLEQTVMRMGRRNMLVILDVHNYARYRGELIGSVAVPTAAFGDLWGRLSTIFEDNPAVYGYGLMNEPGACDWAAAAQAAIDAIRQKDAATRIYVANDYPAWAATYATGDLAAWAERKMPIGNPNILHDPSNLLRWELHVYLDHDASGTYHNTYQFEIERTDGPGARVGPELGIRRAKPFVEWLKKYNQKGFIGEYSAPANPGVDSRWLYALRNTMGYFREHCLASTYWGAGERFYDGTDTVISENGWIVAGGERPQLKLLLKYSASDIPEIETCSNRLDDGMGFIADVSGPAGVPDCYVDIYDLAVFLVNWLDCNNFQDTTCMSK